MAAHINTVTKYLNDTAINIISERENVLSVEKKLNRSEIACNCEWKIISVR